MKKNGFTLVELLGVLVILGIIALIIYPIVKDSIKGGKRDLYNIQISNLESSLHMWADSHVFNLPENDGEVVKVTLDQLKMSGDAEYNIANPLTDYLFPGDMELKITRVKKSYTYEAIEDSGREIKDTEYNLDTPTIELSGNTLMYVSVGESYSDPGYVAHNKDNQAIVASVTIKIEDSTVSNINTNESGTYYVYYNVTSNGLSATVIRTVIVK